MSRIVLGAALAAFLNTIPQRCGAANEYISFSQSPSSDVLVTVQGEIPFCDGYIGWGFIGEPQANLTFGSIAISSVAAGGECDPIPPPYPPPVPYHLTADLGVLANGKYLVTWTYSFPPPIVGTLMTAQAVLWVESGEVPIFRASFE